MPRINQDLLARIAAKLHISARAVYPHVQRAVNETGLEKDLAALVLARRLGININLNRYSTPQQRNQIRGVGANNGGPSSEATATPAPIQRRVAARKPKSAKKAKGNSVFVVHGRDEELRKSLFAFLRALELNPLEWSHAVAEAKGANPYVGQIIDSAMEKVQAVVVLFSPDDLAHLKEHLCSHDELRTEGRPQGQPRPNVLFEAGLALGAHPNKTLLVQIGRVRGFSDIAGKHLVRLSDEPGKRNELANRLEKLGCPINKVGSDWMTAGTFVATEAKRNAKANA